MEMRFRFMELTLPLNRTRELNKPAQLIRRLKTRGESNFAG